VRADGTRDAADAFARAREATERLRAGEPVEGVARTLGDRDVAAPPDALLTPTKLREYLGPTPARAALELEAGQVSDPVRAPDGFHVIQVVEREASAVPPLADIEAEVRAEMRRREGDRALRAYLDRLRADADVRVVETLP
jgi:peptidyl-prolyl cis-trans isomerase SurA